MNYLLFIPEKPCFTRYKHWTLPGFAEKAFTGVDQRTCLLLCLRSDTFYCASVNYNEIKRICTLNGGNMHLNDAVLKPSPSEEYYENECNPEHGSKSKANNTATIRPAKMERCFESLSDSMLLNFDSKLVENVHSLEQCKSECLRASKNGRACGALNWLPNNRGCMLFNIGFDLKLLVQHPTAQFLVNKCCEWFA
ncbi:PAN domain protein [Oesophagostomum dentatum]|uniref:PAN domain protein n=1 Tax=Oesophagostomum dentatum TaxID=61180 RepID=A0A0B1SMS5_OESDE|nr:PAN domain protein [Oesophagostomum dentatum]